MGRGWVGFSDSGAATARLVRTSDGGRTWEPVAASTGRHHSAGSRVWLFFLDRSVGWTVSYAASAPAGGIYRTSDGGRTWSDYTRLPQPGPVRFTTAKHGWLAGYSVYGDFGRLYETFDGGGTWTERTVPPPAGATADDLTYRLPSFEGMHGVLPVSVRHDRLDFYASSDGGRTWRAAATTRVAGGPKVAVAIASRSVWWAIAKGGEAAVTTDAGRTWTTHRRAGLPETIINLEAQDQQTAWASAFSPGEPLRLYATSDGGDSWQPLP